MLRSALLSAFVASALGFAPAARRPRARAGALFSVQERSGIKSANADYLERLESSAVADDVAARAALERTTYLDYLDDALVEEVLRFEADAAGAGADEDSALADAL